MALKEYDLFESSDALSEVTTSDYTEKETTTDTTKASGISSDAEKKSVLDKSGKTEQTPDSVNGVSDPASEETYTSSSISKTTKTDVASKSLDRDLGGNKISPSGDAGIDTLSFLKSGSSFLDEAAITLGIEAKLDIIISSELGCLGSNITNIANALPLADSIKSNISKTVDKFGATLGEVNKILDALTACTGVDLGNFALNYNCGFLFNIRIQILAGIFLAVSCRGIGAVLAIISTLVSENSAYRAAVLAGLVYAMNKDRDPYSLDKLMVIGMIFADTNITDNERRTLRTKTKDFDYSFFLNTQAGTGKSDDSEVTTINLTTALDYGDPNWNKDSNGNENYHKAKGNSTIQKITQRDVMSKSSKPETIDGTSNTALSTTEKMLIIGKNAFG